MNRAPAEARVPVASAILSHGKARSPSEPQGKSNFDRRDRDIAPYQETIIIPPSEVREKFKRVKPLKEIGVKERGWTLDVLNVLRRVVGTPRCGVRTSQRDIPTNTFTTSDVYAFTRELEKLHPDNRHVRDKIRQQLQVLRDAGFLIHIGRGEWKLKP